MKKIAVIGGGPKAAALAAKAWCRDPERAEIKVEVFEKAEFGAAWSGRRGYTDGEQTLCTPAERDVGFPYEAGVLDETELPTLFSEFSWGAYLAQAGDIDLTYREWVDRGRKAPTHDVFARYIAWVLQKAGQIDRSRQVIAIGRADDKWSVTYRGRRGAERTEANFDGVVITGPGPALEGFTRPVDRRITNGVSFWAAPEPFLRRGDASDDPIIIAGSGGTAAAIAAKVTRLRPDRAVIIIGNQAALFTRTESFFENALFTDSTAWRALTIEERVKVTERLNRGVVWSSVSSELSRVRNIGFQPGRVNAATVGAKLGPAPAELLVDIVDANGTRTVPASLVIDAAGFDQWWFLELLPPAMGDMARVAGDPVAEKEVRRDLKSAMVADLSLNLGAAGLHVPFLALAQGPGFGSLMVLGSMSERILGSYVERRDSTTS